MSMTNEQREAIKICEHYKNILYACNYEKGPERTGQAIETALSLIKEQQEEIEKKDKQIDLMAEMIDELSEYYTRYHGKNNEFCKEICIEKDIDCRDCIKQYFERKAEDEK